jgi:hypothetical protein
MLGPMLFVGVGGSGGNTVRAIRENLWRELINRGWTGDFPDCWQTLWIDTISVQDKGGFAAAALPQTSYLGLVPSTLGGFNDVKTMIVNQTPQSKQQNVLSGWMPESCPVPIAKGAGQFRAIGRTIGVSQFSETKVFLERAISKLNSTKASSDLSAIGQLLGMPVSGASAKPTAFVISSMAGGSGSGLFQDVAQMIKLLDSSYDDYTHVMLYGADVFELSISKNMLKSTPGNTLAALAESISGVWSSELSEASQDLFTKAGFNQTNLKRFGGKHHWLIGAKNQHASLGASANEIYRAVASSLSALSISPDTLVWFNNYVLTNVFAGSATNLADNSNLKISTNLDHFQPFASLGFSRVSLGMDRFREYASQAITKAAVQRLLWPEYEPVDPTGPSNDKKIEVRTMQLWEDFRIKSGLNERNPSNDILDYLKPKDDMRFNAFAESAVANAAGRDAAHPASVWEDRFARFFTDSQKELINRDKEALLSQAQSWTEEIQDRIAEATAEAASTSGLKVAQRLVSELRGEIDFLIGSELPADLALAQKHITEFRGPLNKLLNIGKKEIPKNDGVIEKAKAFLRTAANEVTLADRIRVAIELLTDLDKNFLVPLMAEIETSSEKLKTSTSVQGSEFDSFPTLGEKQISARFAPANTDQSLIDYTEFPTLLEEWSKQVLDGSEQSTWQTRLVERAIRGVDYDKLGDGKTQTLIRFQPRWAPQNSSFRSSISGSPTTAGFIFRDEYLEFLEFTQEMLTTKSGSLSDMINMGLRSYVENNSSPAVIERRRNDFKDKLKAALKYCSPMVEESSGVVNALHTGGTAGARLTSASPIPFEGTPLQKDSLEIVISFDPGNSQITNPSAFSSSDSIKSIELYSTLTNAKNPAVFDSLMKPIASDWEAKRDDPAGRQAFWTLRRTKPLIEAVPAARVQVEKMILGWFALAFVGGRKIDTSEHLRGPKVSVYSGEKNAWVNFPHPLLGLPENHQDHDYLPSVLLSLSLALVEINANPSLAPLDAYRALIATGSEDMTLGYKALYRDYMKGKHSQLKSDLASESEIQQQLLKKISDSQNYFNGLFESIESTGNPFTTPQIYEIKLQVLKAFSTLSDAVTRYHESESAAEVQG